MDAAEQRSRRYATSGYRKVPGFISRLAIDTIVELTLAQRRLGVRGPVCEIGTHLGRSFILLHLLTSEEEVSAGFDLYELHNERTGQDRRRRLLEFLAQHGGDPARVRVAAADSRHLIA